MEQSKIPQATKTFYQKVDLRSRKEMVDFLSNHFHYDTMSSWNQSTSYANKVKIWDVIPSSLQDKVFEMRDTEEFYDNINWILEDWGSEQDWHYQAGFNGRSSGYIVMYEGYRKISAHKSYCTSCGQRNFKAVLPEAVTAEDKLKHYVASHHSWTPETYLGQPEVIALGISEDRILELVRQWRRTKELEWVTSDNKCGRCGSNSRKNHTFYDTGAYPGRSIDQDEDFEDWSMGQLKERVQLVQSFDQMCDKVVSATINMATENEVVEETILVPKKIKRLE